MHLHLEIPDSLADLLKARAEAQGLSPDRFVSCVLENTLRVRPSEDAPSAPPFESGYGMLAKYGPAPSAEEIEDNRRDMFRDLAALTGDTDRRGH